MNEFSKYVIETLQNAHLAVDIGTLIEAASREFDLKQIYQILSSGGWKHISLNDKIDQLRWIKSETEQSLMRETSRIGSEAINSMFRFIF
jgi:Xaa-Pro aminopeptidase